MNRTYDKYFVEKNISKFKNNGYTNFLDNNELNIIKKELNRNKIKYNIYESFVDADYKIIYKDNIPKITCFKIITSNILTHQSIMGSLYNFNISEDLIGDIIINNGYYFIVLDEMKQYFIDNFNIVGKNKVKLIEVDIPIYERIYQDIELIVSSLRIDNVISKLTNLTRSNVEEAVIKKDIIINGNTLTNKNYNLKENDIFSIRRYGKYRYVEIVKMTKKDNFVILVKKYI